MKLVFAGTPEVAVPSLRALIGSEHEVAAVVTRPDARSGRGRRISASPVGEVAEAEGIEVLKPARAGDPEFLARLEEIAPDCCPVVAYGALLPQPALDIPRHGWVNLHFSLLPAWRGAAPVQHAVLHGDDITGASTFRIVKELDAGPVYGTLTEAVRPTDTSGELLGRLSVSGAELLKRTVDGIASGQLEPVEQPADGLSYAAKLTPSDAELDFTLPALRVDRVARACTPAPGAWTTFRGTRLKLGPVTPVTDADTPDLAPGRIHAGKKHVLVGTSTHPVALGEVQPQGKRSMAAVDWARGVRPTEDDRLGA
ncbi:methionyl-tRNA formyltransferase [Nocardiopsis tropica]|uniref:Methionyl-tRNA formyltransferase n=1 Tax=Streptomonospora nanhaiensis TaxID=1323731 RepID=A0ABY6YIS1_9ACTN|nr:methionyl-tRNA formyltransferase [Streptomonospora nanhaiensis]WAE72054.1 methionyl-tRNA formyltransferase [Streptomonospora nanhaiensis]